MKKIRVALNGYGVIGKRIADAVAMQEDMELIGVADVDSDWRIKVAVAKNYPVFASTPEGAITMKNAGIPLAGTLDDLLKQVDVICDCTPKKIGALNFEKYKVAGVKSVFQGGEKHALTGHSFVAQANYETALGRQSTRVVSCNTTSVIRVLGALKNAGLLRKGHGVLVRRATDPWESDTSGVINTIVPELSIPSHQTPDAKTVMPDLEITTAALVVAETISHLHSWHVELTRAVGKDEILEVFSSTPRIIFLKASEGLKALNETVELMSDLGRSRGDMYEVGLWTESLSVQGTELFFNYQVYNQAIVIPETIDAIRALSGTENNASASINKTNLAMGMLHGDIWKR